MTATAIILTKLQHSNDGVRFVIINVVLVAHTCIHNTANSHRKQNYKEKEVGSPAVKTKTRKKNINKRN